MIASQMPVYITDITYHLYIYMFYIAYDKLYIIYMIHCISTLRLPGVPSFAPAAQGVAPCHLGHVQLLLLLLLLRRLLRLVLGPSNITTCFLVIPIITIIIISIMIMVLMMIVIILNEAGLREAYDSVCFLTFIMMRLTTGTKRLMVVVLAEML